MTCSSFNQCYRHVNFKFIINKIKDKFNNKSQLVKDKF